MVDASHFFHASKFLAYGPGLEWPNLTSLVLTSRLLTPDECPTKVNDMLQEAAVAAIKMRKLKLVEIWNGREGLAALSDTSQSKMVTVLL
jgi:hypothetical protein